MNGRFQWEVHRLKFVIFSCFFFCVTAVGCSSGGRTAPASSSAVSFEETERLLDESEWATGASSWRLGAAAAAWDEDQIEGAAVASSELLSLVRKNLGQGTRPRVLGLGFLAPPLLVLLVVLSSGGCRRKHRRE